LWIELKNCGKEFGVKNLAQSLFIGLTFFIPDHQVDAIKIWQCPHDFLENDFANEASCTCEENIFTFVELDHTLVFGEVIWV